MSEDQNPRGRHIVPPLDYDKLVVVDAVPRQIVEIGSPEHRASMAILESLDPKPSTFAEDVAASWNRAFQRPANEAMRRAVVWPDIPTSPERPREIKSKGETK